MPADADTIATIAVASWQPIRKRQATELGAKKFAQKF
eukprot:SAG31_NODE_42482_length_271_cov_0.901163_1_plen_36_part_01